MTAAGRVTSLLFSKAARTPQYRPDIDGLRALAILPVVAFHAGIKHFAGGFVGVDIFFVISGFLIANQLQTDIEKNRFSIARFYERRIRRIAPALLVMVAIISAICSFVMIPIDLKKYSESVVCAIFSVSNIYFWLHSGYFSRSALSIPLIQTWSLSVEEQFYLLFPILLYVASKLQRKAQVLVLGFVFLASFLADLHDTHFAPDAAFYLSYARAWELLLGAFLALRIIPAPRGRILCNACVAAGLLLIACSIFLITRTTPFRWLVETVPCVGAALIIAGGMTNEAAVGRLLSWRPLVFVGLISYSLYLWHWPLISLQNTYRIFLPTFIPERYIGTSMFLVCLPVAAASWRWIERPFRDRTVIGNRRLMVTATLAATSVCALALFALSTDGMASRFSRRVNYMSSFLDNTIPKIDGENCFLKGSKGYSKFDEKLCLHKGDGRNYLLLGDSHAADLWYGFHATFKGAHVLLAATSGCRPLLRESGSDGCKRMMTQMYADILLKERFDAVFISARWHPSDFPKLALTMLWWKAHHIPVILIGPSPEFDSDLPRLLIRSILDQDPNLPARHLVPEIARMDEAMAGEAASHGVRFVSLYNALCSRGDCTKTAGDAPIFFDYGHFTKEGSLLAAQRLKAFALRDL